MSTATQEKSIRVLTVDDDPNQLDMLILYLESFDPNIRVEPVTNPRRLRKIEAWRYDCIVADHKMPGMTGIELAQRIRENSEIPFILYTGQGSEDVAAEAFKVGVSDYMKKTADPEHYRILAERIRKAVEKHRARKGLLTKIVNLPEYPRVEIRGEEIVIIGKMDLRKYGEKRRNKGSKELEMGWN